MFCYKLRTLLILLAIGPPLLWLGWTKYGVWRAEQERQRLLKIASAVTGAGDTITVALAIRWLSPAAPPPPADNSNQDTTPDPDGL